MEKIELSGLQLLATLFVWGVIFYIAFLIVIPSQPEHNFSHGWACNEIYKRNQPVLDGNFTPIMLESYPSTYCKNFADAWHEKIISGRGFP